MTQCVCVYVCWHASHWQPSFLCPNKVTGAATDQATPWPAMRVSRTHFYYRHQEGHVLFLLAFVCLSICKHVVLPSFDNMVIASQYFFVEIDGLKWLVEVTVKKTLHSLFFWLTEHDQTACIQHGSGNTWPKKYYCWKGCWWLYTGPKRQQKSMPFYSERSMGAARLHGWISQKSKCESTILVGWPQCGNVLK